MPRHLQHHAGRPRLVRIMLDRARGIRDGFTDGHGFSGVAAARGASPTRAAPSSARAISPPVSTVLPVRTIRYWASGSKQNHSLFDLRKSTIRLRAPPHPSIFLMGVGAMCERGAGGRYERFRRSIGERLSAIQNDLKCRDTVMKCFPVVWAALAFPAEQSHQRLACS